MEIQCYLIYFFAAMCIILGFVALLKQKTYLDSETGMPTQVELPLLGKIGTNIPALVFVFLGAVALLVAMTKCLVPPTNEVDWTITGRLLNGTDRRINFEDADVTFVPPPKARGQVDRFGNVRITAKVLHGDTFENAIDSIEISHADFRMVDLCPAVEWTKFKNGDSTSKVETAGKMTRKYKPMQVELY
ncbi:MAG: hypothetical protein RDU20_08655 [Desulfomonilaceae bacterium]|nr:hypothetical protein [Desulfomonilaceae bacterium]